MEVFHTPPMHTESFSSFLYKLQYRRHFHMHFIYLSLLVLCVITVSSIYQKNTMPRGIPALFVNLLIYVQTKSALDIFNLYDSASKTLIFQTVPFMQPLILQHTHIGENRDTVHMLNVLIETNVSSETNDNTTQRVPRIKSFSVQLARKYSSAMISYIDHAMQWDTSEGMQVQANQNVCNTSRLKPQE